MKKKVLSILLAVFLIAATIPLTALPASAETYSGTCGADGDNLKWSLDTSTGVLDITGSGAMKGYSDEYHSGKYITTAPWGFYYSYIKTVNIGDGVTTIGDQAFYECNCLESVNIGNGVTSIGGFAFEDCSSLKGVYITDLAKWCNIDFGNYYANPLYYAHNLSLNNQLVTDLVIPNGVTEIKDYAFYGCTSIKTVTIPDSVTSIGYQTFSNCSSLKGVYITDLAKWCNISFGISSANPLYYAHNLYLNNQLVTDLVIPDGMTEIKNFAFDGCKSLKNVSIPNSVTTIGDYAFSGCSSLSSVTIPDRVTSIGSSAFYNCSKLTSITIPDRVTTIGSNAFYDCSSLKGVYITDLAKWCNISFGDNSANPLSNGTNFYLNNQLVTDLVIPNGVTQIKSYAFYDCTSIKTVNIPDSVTSIGSSAFRYCSSLASINIGNGVTSIGMDAFSDCSSLASINIGNGVTTIGSGAFRGCSSLVSITIPDSVTTIGQAAFSDCSSLASINIPDSVTTIVEGAFTNTAYYKNESNWEDGVLYIGNHLIVADYISGSYKIKEGTKTIARAAFFYPFGNVSPVSINIPDSVITIGDFAFTFCTSLESVSIGNGVTTIGNSAFSSCSSLESINIPDSVTSIGSEAFSYCTSLESITVGIGNTKYYSQDNCLIEKEAKNLIVGCKNSIIPNDIKVICDFAFSGCSSLACINIPDSVTTIGDYAFSGCSSLASINIPDSVTTIGEEAFYGCSSLKNVYYGGTEKQWKAISIGSNNSNLLNAIIHYAAPKPGDLDGDGETTASDALFILQGSIEKIVLTEAQKKLADVDKDGEINANDALYTLQFSIDLIKEFPDHSK